MDVYDYNHTYHISVIYVQPGSICQPWFMYEQYNSSACETYVICVKA